MNRSNLKRFTKIDDRRRDAVRLLWTICALVFAVSMALYPKVVFDGAALGLKTWWNIVFPALLPFFIASELLMNFGVVHFMGVLLEPVMRPLFNVPGAGSFVMMVGFFSGYPIGSMVTARLRLEGLCSKVEAERLMSFTNNSSPLFMLAAVAIGMFNNPQVGFLIAGAHYLANLTLGLVLRFYGNDSQLHYRRLPQRGSNVVRQAFQKMLQVQREDNRPIGKVMGDAVRSAVTNMLNIGGFIILFAVIIRLLTNAGFIDALAGLMGTLLLPLGFVPDILPALGSGFFEMTIGSKLSSEAAAPLIQQVTAVGMILAWSGLSVHAQVASMVAETDISMKPFIMTRIAHTALAGVYTYLACRLFMPLEEYTAPAMTATSGWQGLTPHAHAKIFIIFLIVLASVLLLALLAHLAVRFKLFVIRRKR